MEKYIKENVNRIFKENCPFLKPDFDEDNLIDLGINSLIFVKIVVNLESFFDFEFDDNDLNYEKFQNVEAICIYIKERVKK